ncbi:cell wall-binding repeat-containing protein [Catenulispora pinisilvae]|uniref:cell wall-binding repeat-containing protein n=1 Tax=Catenulispora pinisilvae TaxID=2705253 RepID=UPI001890E991|nr:cell wall-binding repeat-containing protein [Catenulispora pinisilvae]
MGRKREISVISTLAVAGAAFGGTLVSAPSASAASITVSASGSDVVAINPSAFSGGAPTDQVSQQLAQTLRNSSRYLATTWYNQTYGNSLASDGYLNLDIPGAVPEQTFRLPGMAALSIATSVKLGTWDAAASGISADEAANRAATMVRALAHRYYANNSLAGVSTWGQSWQSPLWAFYTGQAAWLVWDKLSPSERDDVARMLADEANRLTTGNDVYLTSGQGSEQLYQYNKAGTDVTPGDTKAEEDNYDAQLLGLAVAMMPNHPNAAVWQRRNEDLLIADTATQADLSNPAVVNGRQLNTWLQGWNVQPDGTVQNHNILHPVYMTALDQSLQQVGTFALAGRCAPQAVTDNVGLVYGALANPVDPPSQGSQQSTYKYAPDPNNLAQYNSPITMPDPIYQPNSAQINYPQGNDWGKQFPSYYGSFDALVGAYNLAPNAMANANTHMAAEEQLQGRFNTGQTYIPWNPATTPADQAENSYVGAEQRVGQIAAQAYMALWLNHERPACFDNSGNPTPPNVPAPQPTSVSRLAGSDRYGTGVAVSQSQWSNAGGDNTPRAIADSVVLARGDNFPDALAGVPLAKRDRGPLLLTETASLNPLTAKEIQRVLPKGKTVYILGGNVAVSPKVQTQLQQLGYKVVRFGGADRYGTALQIATQGMGSPHQVVVATGGDFADALSAGPLAADEGNAILLSNGKTLDPATKAYIAAARVKNGAADPAFHLNAVGGQAVAATAYLGGQSHSLMGADRYQTAAAVAARFAADMPVTQFGVATGMQFADALTGGAYMANAGEPLLLTAPTVLAPADTSLFHTMQNQISAITLFGGPVAIQKKVMDQIAHAVGGVEH